MGDNNSDKRSRAPNFTREEQMLLCRITTSYRHVIESKKTDQIKHAQKQEAWNKITEVYNANTKSVPRSTENLLACYRNMKSKLKKQHSEAKMVLEDSSQKSAFVDALEENGPNWEAVSKDMNQPVELCKSAYYVLEKDVKSKEKAMKKKILGTGGGPPPSSDDDPDLERFKKMMEPQIDGLFTVYDGDALLMKDYQESLPENKRLLPIDNNFDFNFVVPEVEEDNQNSDIENENKENLEKQQSVRPVIDRKNRVEILKKKKSSALEVKGHADSESKAKKPKTVTDSIMSLSAQKLELIKLQILSTELDIEHKKKVNELELQNLLNHNRHTEEMRKRELILMDLDIKRASE